MRKVLITGGAGFIGSNLAEHLLASGAGVRMIDNLSRAGVDNNLQMLRQIKGGSLEFVQGDIRDAQLVDSMMDGVDEVYHLAAQVAVTSSIEDPRFDFANNLVGTMNVLEAVRHSPRRPFLLFTSTNKVYGQLAGLPLIQGEKAVRFRGRTGIAEDQPLDLLSPYGCSKGGADQYVRDYARTYQLPTVVFRMSCVAGPRQYGNEDQGWLAHFVYSALSGKPIMVYGDGRQVRDILNVNDLLSAFDSARAQVHNTAGRIFNVGGGPGNAASLREALELITEVTGMDVTSSFAAARAGDQRIFVTDHSRFSKATGWFPRRSLRQTVIEIVRWWEQHRLVIAQVTAYSSAPALHGVQAAG